MAVFGSGVAILQGLARLLPGGSLMRVRIMDLPLPLRGLFRFLLLIHCLSRRRPRPPFRFDFRPWTHPSIRCARHDRPPRLFGVSIITSPTISCAGSAGRGATPGKVRRWPKKPCWPRRMGSVGNVELPSGMLWIPRKPSPVNGNAHWRAPWGTRGSFSAVSRSAALVLDREVAQDHAQWRNPDSKARRNAAHASAAAGPDAAISE